MKEINAVGLACPIPVVKARNALREIEVGEAIVVFVDNKTTVENLEKLAKSLKYDFNVSQTSENHYDVAITKNADFDGGGFGAGETIVAIASDKMGEGDETLGKSLMKAFIYALTEADEIPSKIILYNGGATLNIHGSPVEEDLKSLEKKGTAIFTCGACLNHFGLTDKLAAGEITNMYAILEMLREAQKIIKP